MGAREAALERAQGGTWEERRRPGSGGHWARRWMEVEGTVGWVEVEGAVGWAEVEGTVDICCWIARDHMRRHFGMGWVVHRQCIQRPRLLPDHFFLLFLLLRRHRRPDLDPSRDFRLCYFHSCYSAAVVAVLKLQLLVVVAEVV